MVDLWEGLVRIDRGGGLPSIDLDGGLLTADLGGGGVLMIEALGGLGSRHRETAELLESETIFRPPTGRLDEGPPGIVNRDYRTIRSGREIIWNKNRWKVCK